MKTLPIAPVLAALSGALFAQADETGPAAPVLEALRVAVHETGRAGEPGHGIWAAAESYKASFHDGMTFVPYLGTDYPVTQTWSWRTTSVRAGERELIVGSTEPRHASSDHRYEYDFGTVSEVYRVRPDGLEQTFVLHEPVAGDIVVRGTVSTHLRTDPAGAAHRALSFRDAEGREVLRYGEAFVLDARGDRIAIATAFDGGEITLRVPGTWLANAAFPVTIDPLLSRVAVHGAGTGFSVRSVDIAAADSSPGINRRVLLAYVRAASQFDDDVYLVTCETDFSFANVIFTDLRTGFDSDNPACAFVAGTSRWVVVWREYLPAPPTGIRTSSIVGLWCDLGSLSPSAPTSLYLPTGYNAWRPDIGGTAGTGSASQALVVFQRETNPGVGHFQNTQDSDIYGAYFYTNGASPLIASPFPIAADGNDHERPSVSSCRCSSNTRWACAWQTGANNRWGVYAKLIDENGNPSAGAWNSDLSLSSSEHEVAPKIDGRVTRFAVAFSTIDAANVNSLTGSSYGENVYVERFDWELYAGGPSAAGDQAPLLLASSPSRSLEATGIAVDTTDRSHFTVCHREGSSRIHATRIGYDSIVNEGPVTLYDVAGHTVTGAACAFDPRLDVFRMGYAVRHTVGETLYGQNFEYVTPTPVTTTGPGCSAGAISWFGNQQIGSARERVVVSGVPGYSGHFLLVSFATANVPVVDPAVAPGCSLLVSNTNGFLGTMPFQTSITTTIWDFPLPSWLPPMTLHFQDWIYRSGRLESTERLTVPIIR